MKIKTHTYRFVIVGAAGFLFNSCVLLLCTKALGLNKVVAEIVGMLLSLQLTFVLHDQWTYTGKERTRKHYHSPLRKRYAMYLVSNSFGSVLTIVLFSLFSLFAPSIVALAMASLISMAWNYVMNKLIIWKHHLDESNL